MKNKNKNNNQRSVNLSRTNVMLLLQKKKYFTCFNFLKSSEPDASPCMALDMTVFAKDFELPGLPTRNNGMRSSMQINIMKTFSFSALFRAMNGSNSTSSRKTSWHLCKQIERCTGKECLDALDWLKFCKHCWNNYFKKKNKEKEQSTALLILHIPDRHFYLCCSFHFKAKQQQQ